MGGPHWCDASWSRIDQAMADRDPPKNDPGDRLSNLRQRVNAERRKNAAHQAPDSAASLAVRFGGEFGAAIIVGALLGYGADYFLHTTPWGLLIGLGLGFVAGVVNVVRVAQSYSRAHPADPSAPSVPDDEE